MNSPVDYLQIESQDQTDGTIVLIISGEADIESAPRLRSALTEAADRAPRAIVLELSGLEFIDSSGISVLVDAHLRAAREGNSLMLTNVPAQAARVLSVAGLTSTFKISPRISGSLVSSGMPMGRAFG